MVDQIFSICRDYFNLYSYWHTYLYISLNNKKETVYGVAYYRTIVCMYVSIGNYIQIFCCKELKNARSVYALRAVIQISLPDFWCLQNNNLPARRQTVYKSNT